jgi:SAM-dependent methyltransferase
MYLELLKRMRSWFDLEHGLLEAAMHEVSSRAHGRLLDVGCGDKPYQGIFRPYVTEYVGLEYSETCSPAQLGQVDHVYQGDVLPFADAEFDTVLCNQVLEHVPAPDRFFAELVRVLRPEGTLILTCPFSYRTHSIPNDFHRFTSFALARYCERHGLTVDSIAPRGGFWAVIGQKIASHVALQLGHLKSDAQRIGAFGYEEAAPERPRYWALPAVGVTVALVVATTRVLGALDPDQCDTLGYTLVAQKRQ